MAAPCAGEPGRVGGREDGKEREGDEEK